MTDIESLLTIFLDDPDSPDGDEKSKVFVRFYPAADIRDVGAVVDYLHTRAPIPFLLLRHEQDLSAGVEYEALGAPAKMIFGVSPPSETHCDDLIEIVNWFAMNDIIVKILT